METNPVQKLDCTGLLCPVPIIRLAKVMKTLQSGQAVEMLATDPGSLPDMKAYEKQTGNQILESTKQGDVFRFVVKRK